MAEPQHVIGTRTYIAIWAILICLTGLTATVSFIDLQQFNSVVALAIATLKATLVALFFMHVKYTGERMTKVVIIAAVFWLMILIALSLADYTTRYLL